MPANTSTSNTPAPQKAPRIPRTCFVISPIGPEGTEVRNAANDFLELLVEPALEKYGFVVTRADRIAHPTAITTDIVRLVQESDLCVIDLTNSNPNVFYECGRRHETGKAFIQLVAKGHESALPFDVAGIRTVVYDVSSTRAARESVVRLQEFIDTLITAGFQTTTSGDSLGSIAQGLERIDRKVTQLLNTRTSQSIRMLPNDDDDSDSDDAISMLMDNPRRVFMSLLKRGRLDDAFRILDRVRKVVPHEEYIAALTFPVSMGHQPAYAQLEIELLEVLAKPDISGRDDCIKIMADGIKRFHENTGKPSEGVARLISLYDKLSGLPDIDDATKAFVANKVGMLAWVYDENATCIKYTRLAIALRDTEAAYYYNLALVYAAEGMEQELHATLQQLAKLDGLGDEHHELLTRHGYEYAGKS